MKSDTLFLLENAGWPALLVNDSGIICRVNQAAVALFGGMTEGKTSLGASIWSAENETSAEVFLARYDRSPAPLSALKFRLKAGGSGPFLVHICPTTRDGQHFFLFQCFPAPSHPDRATQHPSGEAKKAGPVPQGRPGQTAQGQTLEAGLAQKQKLDCALQLARTVALDFNNALTSILGHTSLILGKIEPNHPWRSSLVEVEKSAERAAEIAHDLAAFSRQEKDGQTQVAGNVNDLVRRTVELFQTTSTSRVTWVLQLEPKLYSVHFDEAKMQQALIKILDNAVQAISEDGRILVRTRNREIAEPFQEGLLRLGSGHYVCIEVEDNGCGIPADVLPRIFEPFFTTKKGPNHRGVGLAWVYGVVTNHGGSVSVSSQPGRGTTVRVYVPALKKFVKDRILPDSDLSGTQTILMIDDEDLLLTLGETVLSSFGYRVLTANSGQKALEIFSQAPEQIDLVITDMVMPVMSGRELIERLRQISPHARIICSSGYVRALPNEEEEIYLQKPFTSQDLLRKVKQALAATEST